MGQMESLDKLISKECRPKFENFNIGNIYSWGAFFIVIGLQIIEVHQPNRKGFELLMHPHQMNSKTQPMPTK